MWALATWEPMTINAEPDEIAIQAAIYALDNQTRIGISLFRPGDTNQDERLVIVGGQRVNVEYWPAGHSEPTHVLTDPHAATDAVIVINFGDHGTLEYAASDTVSQDTAVEAALAFFRNGRINGSHWARYD